MRIAPTHFFVLACLLATPMSIAENRKPDEAKAKAKAKAKASPEKALEFADAIKILGSSRERSRVIAARKLLTSNYPESREMLLEAALHGSRTQRTFAFRILGETDKGSDEVLDALTRGLNHPVVSVRRSAIMGFQDLGQGGESALVAHLPRERNANNRKMLVKTLERRRNADAVPALVEQLHREKHSGVRLFLVDALERLTQRKIGDDAADWDRYLADMIKARDTKALMQMLEERDRQKVADKRKSR